MKPLHRACAAALALTLAASTPASRALNIEFDYSLDKTGYFTADKRATLDQVASIFENNLVAHRAAISDATFSLGDFYDGDYLNPTYYAGTAVDATHQSLAADTVRIYVGATDLVDSGVGLAWVRTLDGKGNGSFAGWGGAMLFDTTTNDQDLDWYYSSIGKTNPYANLTRARDWYFDSDIRSTETIAPQLLAVEPGNPGAGYWQLPTLDFATVAMHELGHVFGLYHSSSSGDTMFPSTDGARQLFSSGDWAAMSSAGWSVISSSPDLNAVVTMPATTPAPTPVPEPASYALMLAGLVGVCAATRRRQKTC